MARGVLVFIEERQGKVKKPSLETLSLARTIAETLGADVTALWTGSCEPAAELGHFGADQVYWAKHALLQAYSTQAYAAALCQAAAALDPAVILGAATAMGRDLLPRAAARLEVGLAQDCTAARLLEDGRLECVRPIFAGKAFARVRFTRTPAMATLRPNVFALGRPETGRRASAVEFTPEIAADAARARVTSIVASGGQRVELTEADIIVSGGRGMKGPENFPLIQELAGVLGGAMGASRAAVDAGWIDHQHQVGQTGKTVSPTLYIACGISGAIQHLAGMSSSKYIVAINKDPEAPIFKVADYGIVGDLFAVVPALTSEIRKLKSQ